MGKKLVITIKSIINSFLDIIYPEKEECIACSTEGFVGLCPYCEGKIKTVTIQEDIFSYGYYGGVLKKVILSFKYDKNFTAGRILTNFLARVIETNDLKGEIICFVPISKKSKKKRGFNQCEILAQNLSDICNIPVSKCLKKKMENREQKTLSKEARIKNVKDMFYVNSQKDIINKIVILIDDVVTTGATLNECVEVLKKII